MIIFMRAINWIKNHINLILFLMAIVIMFVCFVSGCNYHKRRFKCPEITTHTVILHDTIVHQIVDSFPYYVVKNHTIVERDTIRDIDTVFVTKDYYSYHIYDRHWEDTLLQVDLRDTITENRFLGNDFRYKILRPQQIINYTQDNSIHYSTYLYASVGIPFNNPNSFDISIYLASKRFLIGGGYLPLQKGFVLNAGVNIARFE